MKTRLFIAIILSVGIIIIMPILIKLDEIRSITVYAQEDTTWSTSGPYGGVVTAIAVNPSNSDIVFAGTHGAGIFRSSDGGITWQSADNGLSNLNEIHDIAIAIDNPQLVIAATDRKGIFRSSDGGQSWTPSNQGITGDPNYLGIKEIVIAPTDSRVMYALDSPAFGYKLYRSSDAGLSWTVVFTRQNEYLKSVAVDPTDSSIVYLGTEFDPTNGETGLFKSVDGGNSWVSLSSGGYNWLGTRDVEVSSIVFDPVHPQTIYFGISNYGSANPNGVYKSTDAGATWSPTALTGSNFPYRYPWIVIDPFNPQIVYATGGYGANKSTDGGTTWARIRHPPMAISRSNTQILYARGSGGVHKTNDSGNTWSDLLSTGILNTEIEEIIIHPTNPGTAYGITRSSGWWKTLDGGISWNKDEGIPVGVGSMAIDPNNPLIMYVNGSHKSTDGGLSWNQVGNLGFPDGLRMDPFDNQRLFGFHYNGLFLTQDGGETWESILDPVDVFALDPNNQGVAYAQTSRYPSGFYKTINGGITWSRSNIDIEPVYAIAIDPVDSQIVYAANYHDGIYKSTDAGSTWTLIPNSPTHIEFMVMVPGSRTIYATQEYFESIYKSTDGGDNWTTISSQGLPHDPPIYFRVTDLAIDEASQILYLGSQYNGIWTLSLGPTFTISGQVTDAANNPIPDVTISVNSNRSVTTDDNGDFIVPKLIAGTYILTPSKSGYTFSPTSQTIAVPPDATGVDFIGAVQRPPLVFIPGIGGSKLELPIAGPLAELWPLGDYNALSLFDSDNPNTSIFAPDIIYEIGPIQIYHSLIEQLLQSGYQGVVGCNPNASGTPSLFIFPYDWRKNNGESAEKLRELISCIQERHPDQPVSILAHSMGGLVARRYIIDNPNSHHIDKLITIGSPWLGAPKAVNVLETGDFFGINPIDKITRSIIKYVVGSFTGGSQLLPSRAYFDLAINRPLGEAGWDRDGDGVDQEIYSYENYLTEINSIYGYDKNEYHQYFPGFETNDFHSYPADTYLQDYWVYDTSGVEYHHIYGLKENDVTVGTIFLKRKIVCGYFSCKQVNYSDIKYVEGDGTVPKISASRKGNGLDYNMPEATIWEVKSTSRDQDKWAEHNGMPSNLNVQHLILNILEISNQLYDDEAPVPLIPLDNLEIAEASSAHYLTVFGGGSVVVIDDTDNSSAVISGTVTLPGNVPGVTTYPLGDQVEMVILDTTGTYTVTFQTTDDPMAIELETVTGETIVEAIRYHDLVLPPSVKAELRVTPTGIEDLRYDSTGNGETDTTISPTVSVSGLQASDVTPPSITVDTAKVQDEVLVTLAAEDIGSGVKEIRYSLDSIVFEVYTTTLRLSPDQTPILYAFADDNVANRSGLLAYDLQNSQVHLPIILK